MLVVGPSGAGKDALIDAARARFAGSSNFEFPIRMITRAEAPGERHRAVGPERFEAEEAAGHYLLSWRSHGLAYAVPASARADLAAGRIVVVNVSRTVIATAESLVDNVIVLHVTASAETRAARILRRGREGSDALASRLERDVTITPRRSPVIEIANDGALDDAVACFTRVLLQIASGRATQTAR